MILKIKLRTANKLNVKFSLVFTKKWTFQWVFKIIIDIFKMMFLKFREVFCVDFRNHEIRKLHNPKGHFTKVVLYQGGGLKNLHEFHLIGVGCFVLVCIQMNMNPR